MNLDSLVHLISDGKLKSYLSPVLMKFIYKMFSFFFCKFFTRKSVGHNQGLNQYLETGCPKLAIMKFWGVIFFKRPIYWDYHHKHVLTSWNEAKLPFPIMLWKLYWGKQIQLYSWNWHFKKFITKYSGCPEGWFLRVWVSKWHPDALLAKTIWT